MRWRKRGRIYVPDGRRWWAQAYAFPPTPHRLDEDVVRVYVAFCDERTVGRVGYVDVRADRPSEVLRVSERPVLDVGPPGRFDDHGVVPTCVVRVGDELRLYYTGYRMGDGEPYTQLLGLAISTDGGESFERHSPDPVLPATEDERTTRGSAHVAAGATGFRMYYSGGSGFVPGPGGRQLPVYDVRRLESPDGIAWPARGELCIGPASGDEHAIARPWPLPSGGGSRRMLFSYRARSHDYRIGLAVSHDGETWERRDAAAGIAPSPRGWDSEAVAYGAVVECGGATWLLYCGNGRGQTGFGYAELEQP